MTDKALSRLKCFFGVHRWRYIKKVSPCDLSPLPSGRKNMFDLSYINLKRHCNKCRKSQFWIPGVRGNKLGAWEPFKK